MLAIVAPHPDDDVLCCGGVIYKNADNVVVIYVTDGSKGSPRPEERGRELALRRMNEAYSALSRLGVKDKSRVLFLGVEDGSVAKNFAKVYGQLLSVLQRSDITEIYFPSPLDAHPDHSATGKIVLSVANELSRKRGRKIDLFAYNIYKVSTLSFAKSLLTSSYNLIFWTKLKLTWKRVCIKVDNPRVTMEALEQHESQVWWMSDELKALASRDRECFYFKSLQPS